MAAASRSAVNCDAILSDTVNVLVESEAGVGPGLWTRIVMIVSRDAPAKDYVLLATAEMVPASAP